jgi:hypothetical protein
MKWMALLLVVGLYFSASIPPSFSAQRIEPDDCRWTSNAHDRNRIKNRAPIPDRYLMFNGGRPISIAKFYDVVCKLKAPAKADVPPNVPIQKLEEETMTVRGFLLAVKFERGEDHDIHAQISDSANWNSDQLIIEIPAGRQFCHVRRTLWNMVRQDRQDSRSRASGDSWAFRHPPQVVVSGYLFLDSHHIKKNMNPEDYCNGNGDRGLSRNNVNRVRGIWELHPVIAIEPAS